jgi:hypothetical protein
MELGEKTYLDVGFKKINEILLFFQSLYHFRKKTYVEQVFKNFKNSINFFFLSSCFSSFFLKMYFISKKNLLQCTFF